MRFLRLLFWLILALLAALFLGRNWTDVTVDLWGNLQADIKLPLLILIAFFLGYLPSAVLWRTRLWRMKRTLVHPAPGPASAPADQRAP